MAELDRDVPPRAGARPRRRSLAIALVVAAAVVGTGAVVVTALGDGGPRSTEGPVLPDPELIATGPGRVCGVPDLTQVVDDGREDPRPATRVVVDDVSPATGSLVDLRVADDQAYVLSREDASYTVTAYGLDDGGTHGTQRIDLEWDGSSETFDVGGFEVDEAGAIYLLDTLMGRRDLLKVGSDGEEIWRVPLPPGPQTTGSVIDLYGTARWQDPEHGTVVGVGDAGAIVHRVTSDGETLPAVSATGAPVAGLPGGRVVLSGQAPSDQQDSVRRTVTVVASDGSVGTTFGADVPAAPELGVPSVPWTEASGAASAPEGGLLLADPVQGVVWYDDDGVRRGVWPADAAASYQPLAVREESPLVEDDGTYYLLTDGDNEGSVALTAIESEEMAAQLRAPVRYGAATESVVATLGFGAGLLTERTYGVFRADEEPRVVARFDETWADASQRYALRYQVRGDPRVPDPVVGPAQQAALPRAGGDVELELPRPRPGVYEVDAALVDDQGAAVSGTCLRYTVLPSDSAVDITALADGADWGGPAPLRGVQLADQLGTGSHRIQLDFGALVSDPTAAPDATAIDWTALPGADLGGTADDQDDGETTPGDPFADIAAAVGQAEESGTRIVVQVGQGGEAELGAASAGTWEGWVALIIERLEAEAPGIRYWAPWNEPNGTGLDDPVRYEREVGAPFARAVRAASPEAFVVGGNTLGFALDWWEGLVAADGCRSLDVVAIHPYTGYNRSWEEEGFSADGAEMDRLRQIVAPCGDVPVWDTETGWWSDGVVNFWASGWDVARKLWWYAVEDVEEWTYFFSEGGFEGTGTSWSLLQYGSHLKPAGAVMAATAPLLEQFDDPTVVETGTPGVHAMRSAGPDGSSLLALWSEGLSTSVIVRPGDAATPTVVRRDVYGAESELDVADDGTEVPVTASPVMLLVPEDTVLEVEPVEPFGTDVLQGRPVTVSSRQPDWGDPEQITSGTFAVRDPWRSGSTTDGSVDESPTVEITTDGPTTVDRIAVATAGIRCCTTGLRTYAVSVRSPDGTWQEVALQEDQLWDRVALFHLDPVEITAVRVSVPWTEIRQTRVLDVNYSGVLGGPPPSFMELATRSDGVVAVSAVRAWGPPG